MVHHRHRGASSLGLAASGSGGGTLISRIPIPDGTYEAEVRSTLKLITSGGTYTAYLQASADAATSGSGSGSYLAFEMQNPQFDADGGCTANFLVLQRTGGVVSLLSSFAGACRDGMVLRMAVHGNALLVWPDQDMPMEFVGVTPAPASPESAPTMCRRVTPFRRFNWAPSTGPRPTPGIRKPCGSPPSPGTSTCNGSLQPSPLAASVRGLLDLSRWLVLSPTAATTFSDETVAPGENHTYGVHVVDRH